MPLKPKQEQFMKAFRSGRYKYLCGAGTTGSGKTFLDLAILDLLCIKVPGARFFVGRKSEKNLKQNTIPSYKQMQRKSGTEGSSAVVDMSAKYNNGSEIVFIWCDITKDPDLNNIRGLEVNGGLFEEANQIHQKYFELAKTRIGRWRRDLGIIPFIFLTLNPSIGWVKDVFYDRWKDRTLPSNHYFLEFDVEDARHASGTEYVDTLQDLARPEYERFVMNRWNYSEAANQLISYEWYKQCALQSDPEISLRDFIRGATDPAWDGDDPTGFARMHNNHIGWWEMFAKQDPDISGTFVYDRVKNLHVKKGDWIIDPVGVGSATVLKLRNEYKYEPDLFYGNDPATDMFGILPCFNARSEAHWLLRECMRQEEITFTDHPDFRKQCLALTYYLDDKKIRIVGKKDMKPILNGVSPTYTDLAMMLVHRWKTQNSGLAKEILERQTKQTNTNNSSRAHRERAAAVSRSRNEWM